MTSKIINYKHKDDSILNVHQSNALIEATYKMSVPAKRLMFILLSQVDQRSSSPTSKAYTVSAKDYALTCKISETLAYRQLKNASKDLMQTIITEHNDKTNTTYKIVVSSSAIYRNNEGIIEVKFAQEMQKNIWYLRENFTKFKLMEAVKFKRFYTARLYELLMQYDKSNNKNKKTKIEKNYLVISVEKLKRVFDVLNIKSYNQYSAFNRFVIKPSVKEIQEKTNLVIKASTLRTGRAITSIRFDFEREKQSDMFKK